MASPYGGLDFMGLLQNAFAGRFSPRQEDGLARMAMGVGQPLGQQRQLGVHGPATLSWQELIQDWSRQGGGVMDQRWRGFIRQPQQRMFMGGPGAIGWHQTAQQTGQGGGIGQMDPSQFLNFLGQVMG